MAPSGATAVSTSTVVDAGTVLVAAGDIACAPGEPAQRWRCQMEATARLVEDAGADVVAALGDLQYERGELANFEQSYQATWGRFRDVTRPAAGNHEYGTGRAPGYFDYWGERAGERGKGWYSYDLPGWHVVVLNSVCSVVGCGEGSEQLEWLRADLASSDAPCTLAYWHHPRLTSGLHGEDASVEPLWRALADHGAEAVLSGHDHHYERFAPVDGIRQFVVGTGGHSLYPVIARAPGSEAVHTSGFGVLVLTLRDGAYSWRWSGLPGARFRDQGDATCH